MLLEVQFFLLVLSTVALSSDKFNNDIDDPQIESNVKGKCRCVEWSLCDENGNIITDGSDGLLSGRSSLLAPTCDECGECPIEQLCCRESANPEGPSWDTCGVNKYQDATRSRVMNPDTIISQTRFAEFPWTLMLLRAQRKPNGEWHKYVFRGGASIIHSKIALTVAHLVQGVNEKRMTVRAGEWNTSSNTEEISHQDRSVEKIYSHPSFDEVSLINDIALLILDRPFEIAENVAPVCLPFPDVKYNQNDCVVAGWGTNRLGPEGIYSTTLRKVHLPIVSNKECEKKLKKTNLGKRFRLHFGFVCAGGKQDQDACLGDGGGPLMCRTDDGAHVQIGIVSWGVGCGNLYPGVYIDVSKFLYWIVPIITNVEDSGGLTLE